MHTKQRLSVCPLVAAALMFTVTGRADTLSIDGQWHSQYELMGASGETFSTTYTATQNEAVLITGFYENTDQYKVFVDGSLALTTPPVPVPAVDYGDTYGTYTDPGSAWQSGLFSKGTFYVSADDTISIEDIGPLFPSTYSPGSFDAQVALQAVPEPVCLTVFGLGALVAGFGLRRKRTGSLRQE